MTLTSSFDTVLAPSPSAVRRAAPSLSRAARAAAGAGAGILLPALLLLLWHVSAVRGWLPPQILPEPLMVLATFREFVGNGDLWFHTGVSLQRLALGFAAGATAGLAIGVAMGLSQRVFDYLNPIFVALAQIPSLGWIPFVMILVGIDDALKVIVIAKASFVPVALNTTRGIRNVPLAWLEVGRVLTFEPRLQLTRIVLPAAVPPVFTGLRYGLTHAWMALVAVELVASSEGIGYLTVWARQLFQLDILLMAMATIGVIGFAMDRALALVEQRLDRWRFA